MKINKVAPGDSAYLHPLLAIDIPPASLTVLGRLPEERRPTIAVVGTRKPTTYGREVTEMFTRALARKGIIVVSGLALGIDALAHRAALDAGGTTIGVIANPLPDIYPATNRQLAAQIIDNGGAVVSEYGPDDHYVVGRWSFLERNRIVSGLSDAILITEATASSGTINTASHALAQGKEVFVIPGNITSPSSAGCNSLIKQGATPVTTPDDILEFLLPEQPKSRQASLPFGDTQLETDIIQLIHSGVRDGDAIQQQIGVPVAELNATLTMMELRGLIKSLGANQWIL